jgi:anti-sigma regulatory factor (Ser/Thr protein kinase)
VKFESTRTARPARFDHRAAFYHDPADLLATAVPIAGAALSDDIPVALLTSPATEAGIRAELGDSPGLIPMPPTAAELRMSGQATVTRWARQLRELTEWAGPLIVLTEHHPDRTGLSASAWTEADAAMNVALSALPITMTCLFPRQLARASTEAVTWNHSRLLDDAGTVWDNPDVRSPADVLASHPVAAPPRLGRPDRELTFTPWQLIDLRSTVAAATAEVGMDVDRADDFVLAVNEVAGNAVEHGSGVARLHIWRTPDFLVCEIHDTGRLDEALVGLRTPHPNNPRGRGLWIARQLCDMLHVWSDQGGTHVRMHTAVPGRGAG